ncbi:MAG: hypothetical protein Q9M92_10915 [Enterobacterales bacterium]|nr:hypothetical protein [Enterobacterales bacterium]
MKKLRFHLIYLKIKKNGLYAVVPYSSGLPQLSLSIPKSKLPKDVQKALEGFRTTKETVHSHGPKVTWNRRLERKTRAFINNYGGSNAEKTGVKK